MALRAGAVGAAAREAPVTKRTGRNTRAVDKAVQPAKTPAAPAPAARKRVSGCAKKRAERRKDVDRALAEGRKPPRRKPVETPAELKLAMWRGLLRHGAGRVELAEELLHVRAKNGRLVPLVANEVQRRFEERRGAEDVVLKARQMGMSTWIAGQFLLRTLLVPGTVTLQVAHTKEAAMGLFRIVQRMWLHLDPALRADVWKQGRKSKTEMTFPAIDSELRIASAGEENAGRGLTVTNLHLSEVARWQGDAAETLAGLRASLAPRGLLVMESTPNGAYGCFYKEWQTAERQGAVRHFFPWWMEPGYRGRPATELTDEEAALVAAHGLVPEQIGFRRQLRERFAGLAAQEFAEDAVSCFRESGTGLFESDALAARLLTVPEPCERRWNGALQIWRPAMSGRQYIVAADPAGGGMDGDWSTAQVVDVATGMQCAELQVRLPQRMFALRLAELAREFGNALLVVERNNHGAGVLAFLSNEGGLRMYEASDRQGGFLTTAQSRAEMLAGLGVLLANRTELFVSTRLLEECRTFVMREGGRTEAAAGSHDDLVMAMAIAHLVRRATAGRV